LINDQPIDLLAIFDIYQQKLNHQGEPDSGGQRAFFTDRKKTCPMMLISLL